MLFLSVLFIVCAYFIGAFPHLRIIARLNRINQEGDLHLAFLTQGKRLLAVAGVIIDIAKGIIVIVAGKLLDLDIAVIAIGGLSAVAGQMWPVFTRFEGEKGNSISVGYIVALTPVAFIIIAIPMLAGVIGKVFSRYNTGKSFKERLKFGNSQSLSIPVGMAVAFLIAPIISGLFNEPPIVSWCYALLFLFIMIRRITARLKEDLGGDSVSLTVIKNRILYDRSRI
jgi:glycerol-3-phosphate acyltransferase PlsY